MAWGGWGGEYSVSQSEVMKIGIDVTCWLNRRGFGRFVRELVSAIVRLETDHEYVLFADGKFFAFARRIHHVRDLLATDFKSFFASACTAARGHSKLLGGCRCVLLIYG